MSGQICGIPYGKHKVHLPLADGKKSWEGTAAMFVSAFLAGMVMLAGVQHMPAGKAVLCVLPAAFAGAAAELFTASEYDTVTVPLTIAAVLLLMKQILAL